MRDAPRSIRDIDRVGIRSCIIKRDVERLGDSMCVHGVGAQAHLLGRLTCDSLYDCCPEWY